MTNLLKKFLINVKVIFNKCFQFRKQKRRVEMLRVMKNSGKVSTSANDKPRGTRGRVELCAQANGDGTYSVSFDEYGNYGKLRWHAETGVDRSDVQAMVDALSSLLGGQSAVTLEEFVQEQPTTPETSEEATEAQPEA